MKIIIILLMLISLLFITPVMAGTDTVGSGGSIWSGNVTTDNLTQYSDGDIWIGDNISEYTEVDPSNHWSQNSYRNTGTTVANDENSYVYKDYGVGYFGNFKHNFTFNFSYVGTYSKAKAWALSNNLANWTGQTDALCLYFYPITSVRYRIYLLDKSTSNTDYIDWVPDDTAYYFNINRTGTTLTCSVYNDSARTDLYDTLVITSSATTFRYLFVGMSEYDGIAARRVIQYTEDLRIGIYSGNLTRNYTSILGVGEELQSLKYNGSTPTAILNVDLYASTDNISYTLIQANTSINTNYDVSGNGYEYAIWKLNTTNISLTPIIFNITGVYGSKVGTPTPVNLAHTKNSTWVNHTWDTGSGNVTDSYNVSINETWHNGTTNEHFNNTPIPTGNWSNITVWAWNSTYSELSAGSVSENVQTGVVPTITAYYPTVTIWPEVNDSQLFNVTVNQSTQCRWYINGSLVQTNSTPSLTHSYTNTSLKGGDYNITAIVNNTNGTDSQTWLFEVGADSITYILLQHDPTNQSMIDEFNVTRIGSNVTDWGFWENHTFSGWNYFYRYTNGTEIMNQTASYNNESLWFNGTTLLPTGVYFVNATTPAVNTSTIIIPANSYGMFNNWTVATTFTNIAANESNDVCYTYYNVTSGLWESYYIGYSWNSDYQLSKNASVIGYFDAQTNITSNIITPSSTELYTGWNMLGVQNSSNQSISGIIADIGANCSDSWYFNSSTGGYSNTTTHSIQPNQGFLTYITQSMTWTRSTM